VLADPGLAIVPSFFLGEDGGGPPGAPKIEVGGHFTAVDDATGTTREFRVAAFTDHEVAVNQRINGALVTREVAEDVLAERAVESRFYVAVDKGADPEEVAARLQGGLLANGAQAETFRHQVRQDIATQIGFFRLMQGYLGLGLLIGIAGLGVVMVRAVRERRRQIGMLRAMGFSHRLVRTAFLVEAGFIALQGVLIGVGLAIVSSYQLLSNTETFGEGSMAYEVPWATLAVVLSVALIASILATAGPATQAARIKPAVALRIAD
jgi:putative ABC transport system permease protein